MIQKMNFQESFVSEELFEKMQEISKVVGIKKMENSEEGSADLDFTIILGPKYVAE